MLQVQYYSGRDGTVLPMHIYFPDDRQKNDKKGTVILFYGGWWMGGSVRQFYPQARELAALGMVCILPDYRTFRAFGTPVETALYDAGAAVRHILEHTDAWGIDPRKIALGGASAGGHLAISLLLLDHFRPAGLEPRDISALLLMNPVLDVEGIGNPNDALLRSKFSQLELSPFHHIKPDMPNLLLFQGTADTIVPCRRAEEFAERWKSLNGEAVLHRYNGREHGFFNLTAGTICDYYDVLGKMIRFLFERSFFSL